MILAHFETYGEPARAEQMAAMVIVSTRPWGEMIIHRIGDATETRLTALFETTLSEEWFEARLEHVRPAEPVLLLGVSERRPLGVAAE